MVVYTVYADDKLIHHSESSAPEVKLINPRLSMEENSSGSFSCTIPPSNVGYDFVTRITTEIRIKRQTIDSQTGYLGAEKEIWSGRVIDEKTDFFNNRQITCEGALSYLNDTIQPQAKYENYTPENMLRKLIDNHNTKAVPYVKPGSSYSYNHRFYVGAVTVHDPDTQVGFTTYETNFESTMDDVNSKLLNTCGGHLVLRRNASDGYNYIDYLEEYSKLNNQKIEFGKNLLDFSKSFDVSSICTVLIPLGERLEGEVDDDMDSYLTVESVNGGSIYVVNTEAVNTFGWIEKTVHFDDIEDPSVLLRRARRYLQDTQFEQLTLELTAVDMHYLGIDDGELFELYDMVHCTSKPHGLDRTFPIKKVEIPLDNPQNTTFTIGDNTVANTLSSSLTNSNATINAKIDALPSTTSVLKEAKRNADQLMRQLSNGYISTIIEGTDENAHSEAQVISNAQNLYEDATKFWIWNINGLAHYSGTWTQYKAGIGKLDTAITMDGTIVADRILTGTLGKPEWGNYWNMETGEFILSPGKVKTDSSTTLSSYMDGKINTYDGTLDQQKVFNRLTNNGQTQGIYLSGGKVYINGEYIKANSVSANLIHGGTIVSNNETMEIDLDNNKIKCNTLVVDATNFSLDSSGNMSATSASLDGATITNASISNGTITNASISNGSIDSATMTNANITGELKTGSSGDYVKVDWNAVYGMSDNSERSRVEFNGYVYGAVNGSLIKMVANGIGLKGRILVENQESGEEFTTSCWSTEINIREGTTVRITSMYDDGRASFWYEDSASRKVWNGIVV